MARKNLEKVMDVNGIEVPVRYNQHLDSDTFGQFIKHGSSGPRIEYSVTEPDSLVASVMLHEGIHALSDMNGMDLSESQVQMLESLLPAFIRNNIKLFEPILKVRKP